jgi:hypothetical protein
MRSLTEIYVINGQSPEYAFKPGKFEYNEKAGCLVYVPPAILDLQAKEEEARKNSQ